MSKKALIVIDIQNEYFENGGLTLVNPVEASANAGKVIEHFRANNLPIIHFQHLSADPQTLPIFVEGTKGAEIHENVLPLKKRESISKKLPKQF